MKKMPTITAKILYCSNLMPMITGTAKIIYLKNIDPREVKAALPLDLPSFMGNVSPIKMKLTILKTVPRIKPLPVGA